MIRATKAQLYYVETLMELGAAWVDKYSLTISTADKYIKEHKILLDMEIIGDLRPEDLNIPNH